MYLSRLQLQHIMRVSAIIEKARRSVTSNTNHWTNKMNNNALYYPTIEFTDFQYLWSASLLWDHIYRIVPRGYEPNDPPEVLALMESDEIGIPIHPDNYASSIAEEFLGRLDSGEWNASALTLDIPNEYRRLHMDKVDVVLRDLIIARGVGEFDGEWLHVPKDFVGLYMTYLANVVANRNHLQMLSDSTPAWTGATYFKYNGEIEGFPHNDFTQQLATIVVRDYLPTNILSIKPRDILSFREKYRAERQRFLFTMKTWAKRLSECDDNRVGLDLIQDMNKDVEASLKEYRGSLSALRISTTTGLLSLTIPIATNVAALIGGKDLQTSTLLVGAGAGLALGLVSGLTALSQKKKKLTKECDFSYLMDMEREWKGISRGNTDYNYYLCREMEEFIND